MDEDSIYKYPEQTIITKYGHMRLWSTGTDHIGVSTDGDPLTVNGVSITARVDLHRRGDWVYGVGAAGPVATPYERYRAFSGSRSDGDWRKPVSTSAINKVVDEVERIVNEFVATTEGKKLVLDGQRRSLLQEKAGLERKAEELHAATEELQTKFRANDMELAALSFDEAHLAMREDAEKEEV